MVLEAITALRRKDSKLFSFVDALFDAGKSVTYTATATDAYNNNWNITNCVTWSISSGADGDSKLFSFVDALFDVVNVRLIINKIMFIF